MYTACRLLDGLLANSTEGAEEQHPGPGPRSAQKRMRLKDATLKGPKIDTVFLTSRVFLKAKPRRWPSRDTWRWPRPA